MPVTAVMAGSFLLQEGGCQTTTRLREVAMKGMKLISASLVLLGSFLLMQGMTAASSPLYECVWTGGGKISGPYFFNDTTKPMIVDYSLLLACPPGGAAGAL
jgi:hypothetical protein